MPESNIGDQSDVQLDEASKLSSTASEVHTSVLEKLKLEIELCRVKMQLVEMENERPVASNRPNVDRCRVGEYAREMKGVLTSMPESEALVPAWFTSVETVFTNFEVPGDVQGPILLTYLNERMRAVIARKGNGQMLDYDELKQTVLNELRLTPGEYKRLFFQARKTDGESWNQFTRRLETLFDHYVVSRKIKTLEELRSLMIADRLKAVMPEETRSYLMLTEADTWLKPCKLAELAENFDESKKSVKPRKNQNVTANKRSQPDDKVKQNSANSRHNTVTGDSANRGRDIRCFECGQTGHYKSKCPILATKSGRPDVRAPNVRERDDSMIAKISMLCKEIRESQGLDEKEPPILRLCVDQNTGNARLDSGADVTVVRRSIVPEKWRENGSQKVQLRGAFGHVVDAELTEIPLGLEAERECAPQVLTLCAVTDELAVGIDVLLTPEDYEDIRNVRQKLESDAEATTEHAENQEVPDASIEQNIEHCGFEQLEIENEVLDEGCLGITANAVQEVEGDTPTKGDEARRFTDEQREDESLRELWEQAKEGTHGMIVEDGLLFHEEKNDRGACKQLVLPKSRRAEVLALAHDSPWGGHFSGKKTKQRVKSAFYWPSVVTDIKKYCQSCHSCQIFSRNKETDRVPITPVTRPEKPFEVIYIDCIGPLDPPSARGHKYALSIVDLCTRWPEVIPLRSLTAKSACQALIDVFARYGTPEMICCDQGTNFTSKLTQEVTARMGVQMRFSTPNHPQSNGLVERWNGTFKAMLKHVIETEGREWDRFVPCLLWAYREVPNDVTGASPFELMFGREPNGPLAILKQTWTGDWTPPTGLNKPAGMYLKQLRERMAEMSKVVSERTARKQKEYASRYNLRTRDKAFQPGDVVLILESDDSSKLKSKWKGPVTVKQKKREGSYLVTLDDGTERWLHANRLRPYVSRVNAVGVIFEEDEEFGKITTVPQPVGSTAKRGILNISPNLTAIQQAQLKGIISEFDMVFDDKPGKCKVGCHRIQLEEGAKLGKSFPYKVPVALRPEVDRQVKELLQWGLIYPIESDAAHPVVCVAKKDGSMRMCIDFRKLNAVSKQDQFPMQNVSELVYGVSNSRYITVLDLTRGYWQIPVEQESQRYTAFATPQGLYAWTVMPYGLKNSAATFQRTMNEILSSHKEYSCVYIDDVAIHSNSWEQHVENLKAVLSTLREAGLTVNVNKCRFGEPKVKYLGHWVGSGTHSPDPDKVAAIMELKRPTDKTQLRSALGMLNFYRDYIPDYAEIVLPLTALTNRRVPNKLPWDNDAEAAFERVKSELAKIPELVPPDPSRGFILTTDASERAVGACLSQMVDGEEMPIAFLSKKLSPSQSKWSAIEREAFAVVWALGRLDTWLFGMKIQVRTDHNPLTYLSRSASDSARLTRWSLALQKYDLEVRHIKGALNRCADALSRLV